MLRRYFISARDVCNKALGRYFSVVFAMPMVVFVDASRAIQIIQTSIPSSRSKQSGLAVPVQPRAEPEVRKHR